VSTLAIIREGGNACALQPILSFACNTMGEEKSCMYYSSSVNWEMGQGRELIGVFNIKLSLNFGISLKTFFAF
jgi:hypothetical protein